MGILDGLGDIADRIRDDFDNDKGNNNEDFADGATEEYNRVVASAIANFERVMTSRQEYAEGFGLEFPPLTWSDLYTRGSSVFDNESYRAYNRLQSLLEQYQDSLTKYLEDLENREYGEGNNVDWEEDLVKEEIQDIEDALKEESERIAEDNAKFSEFSKIHEFYSRTSQDNLYNFVAVWTGETIKQPSGENMYSVAVKITRHDKTDPLGKRLVLFSVIFEIEDYLTFKFTPYKNEYKGILDELVVGYNAQSTAPPTVENTSSSSELSEFFSFSMNNLSNSIKQIPRLFLCIFNGILIAIPFLMLIWGTYFSVKFILKQGKDLFNIADEAVIS